MESTSQLPKPQWSCTSPVPGPVSTTRTTCRSRNRGPRPRRHLGHRSLPIRSLSRSCSPTQYSPSQTAIRWATTNGAREDDPGVDGPTFGIELGSYVLRDKCIEGIISIGGVSTEGDYYVSMEAQTGVGFYNDCAVDTLGSRRPRHVLHRPAKPQSGLNPVLPAAQGRATVEKPAPLRSSYRRSSNFAI